MTGFPAGSPERASFLNEVPGIYPPIRYLSETVALDGTGGTFEVKIDMKRIEPKKGGHEEDRTGVVTAGHEATHAALYAQGGSTSEVQRQDEPRLGGKSTAQREDTNIRLAERIYSRESAVAFLNQLKSKTEAKKPDELGKFVQVLQADPSPQAP